MNWIDVREQLPPENEVIPVRNDGGPVKKGIYIPSADNPFQLVSDATESFELFWGEPA